MMGIGLPFALMMAIAPPVAVEMGPCHPVKAGIPVCPPAFTQIDSLCHGEAETCQHTINSTWGGTPTGWYFHVDALEGAYDAVFGTFVAEHQKVNLKVFRNLAQTYSNIQGVDGRRAVFHSKDVGASQKASPSRHAIVQTCDRAVTFADMPVPKQAIVEDEVAARMRLFISHTFLTEHEYQTGCPDDD